MVVEWNDLKQHFKTCSFFVVVVVVVVVVQEEDMCNYSMYVNILEPVKHMIKANGEVRIFFPTFRFYFMDIGLWLLQLAALVGYCGLQ